jgi:hypothetical protein
MFKTKRVEIPPYYDLWMQGARMGTVRKEFTGDDGVRYYKVNMDHPQVKRLATVIAEDCVERNY